MASPLSLSLALGCFCTTESRLHNGRPISAPVVQSPYSLLRGELEFGAIKVECHVLSDYRRVITQSEIVRAITGGRNTNLSRYLARNPLLVNGVANSPPIRFVIPKKPIVPTAFEGTALIEICDKYL